MTRQSLNVAVLWIDQGTASTLPPVPAGCAATATPVKADQEIFALGVPLRERQGDIPKLVSHFVEIFGRRMGKRITQIPEEAMEAFTSYSWPGNVRELQNLVERAVILSSDGVLPNPLSKTNSNPVTAMKNPVTATPAQGTFSDSQRALILQALQVTGWVIGGAAGAAERKKDKGRSVASNGADLRCIDISG